MNYEWDEVKERLNIAKHNVDFNEAKSVFADEYGLVVFDEDHSDDEERFYLLGVSNKERILLVVHCYREGDTIRIISARKATAKEKKQYKDQK
ncbi:TPA: BrnT family toxin [Campylobacter lari]|uniref:BrnT family toxin n=1 Tax=Campylobacter peloridis TaxID=488546 RepID=A0A5C7DPH5_9BACT|nr:MULTISPECIES: BrnT family toxin [Campylobacter]EAH8851045.1 BrnT family toxin [Campylobacter lari]MCR8707459.1 BrnT family toxin [Campylobacter sp. W0066.2]MCR8709058.1 BrnT family toxin [Campylobacter sp. RM5063]EAK5748515.1 BrnT family toxin [Campylobacter lari]EAK9878172.1 BrnT family toxin [Campylobacter lari]